MAESVFLNVIASIMEERDGLSGAEAASVASVLRMLSVAIARSSPS